MKRSLTAIVFFILFLSAQSVSAQATGDFRSFASGNWGNVATWERFNGTIWVNPAPNVPSNADGLITILNSHNITDAIGATADQFVINSGGILTISGVTFTVAAGPTPDDLNVNSGGTVNISSGGTLQIQNSVVPPPPKVALVRVFGTINNAGTISNASAGTLTFEALSVYDHQHTSGPGVIPTASWNLTSTCQITGYTSNTSPPTGLSQSFGNFTWDTGSSSGYIDLNGGLTTVNGNLLIQNVPSSYIYLTGTTNYTLNVGGDFTVSNCYMGFNSSATVAINVTGNVLFSGNGDLNPTFSGTTTINATNDLEFSGGTTNLTYGGSASVPITVGGNFTLSSSPIINNGGSGTYTLTFNGSGLQNYIASQAFTDYDFTISNGSTVHVASGNFFSGSGTFTLLAGGTLGVGSVNGLVMGAGSGNVRTTNRSYTANANIIYNGSVAQSLGDEWSTSGALNTVAVNLEIDNTNGVTNNIIGGTSVVGNLTLTNGPLNIGNSNSLDVQSNFNVTSGTIGGLVSSNLSFSGSGTMDALSMGSGAQNLDNLTISRAGDLVLASDLTIAGTLSLVGNLDLSGASARTLTLSGTMTGAGGLKSNTNSNLVIGGGGAFGIIRFNGTNQLNSATFNSTGTFTWSSTVTINSAVNHNLGTLTHSGGLTMANNTTYFKGQGSVTGIAPLGSSYNVEYIAAGTTSLELPTVAGTLNDLTIDAGGTVTLANDVTVNNDLILNGGVFDASTNDVTMAGTGTNVTANGGSFTMNSANAINFTGSTTLGGTSIEGAQIGNTNISGTLNAPAANIFVSGLFNNTGTFNAGTGTITFNGASSSIAGSTTTFHNLNVSNVLTAPSGNVNINGSFTNLGTFNHNNGTVTFVNPASEILGSGGTAFNDIIFSGTGELSITSTLDVNGDLTLASGSNLDANIGNNDIEIAGNWVNNGGSFNARAAQVLFDGGTMNINGTGTTDFNDITTSTSTLVNVNGKANLEGSLVVGSSATFDANGGTAGTGSGTFTIISNATDDGRIAALPSGASVIDDLTFQRRIPQRSATNKWSNIGLAVRDATIADMQNEVPISGSFTGADPGPLPSLAYYDNTTDDGGPSTGTMDARWVPYPTTSNSATFTTTGTEGRGYSLWMNGTGDITFDLRGPVNQGTLNLNLSGLNEMWNLVGNPYPSSIDWDTGAGWTKTSIQGNTIYVWDGAQYLFWSGTVGTHGNGRIPMGMSFWVQGSAGSVALAINESAKTATTGTVHRLIPATYIEIALSDGTYTDKTFVELKDGANTAFEINDASKLQNAIFNLSSYSTDDHELAINAVSNDIICSTEIPLNISNISPGSYTIDWANLESLDPNIEVILNDKFLGESYNLTSLAGDITIDVTSDAASFGKDRFSLIIKELDFSTDLVTSGDQVCDAELVGSITIEQSEDGVLYDVYDSGDQLITSGNGIGENLLLALPPESLALGDNSFTIKASRGECAEQAFADPVIVNIIDVPVITYDAMSNSLSTDAVGSLQWYENGEAIPGETSTTLNLGHATAEYHVVASNESCDKSSEILLVTGLEDDLENAGIALYPNPVNDIFHVKLSKSALDDVLLRVLTVNGKVVEERLINTEITSISAMDYESGIYLIEIIDNNKRHIIRLIKQ